MLRAQASDYPDRVNPGLRRGALELRLWRATDVDALAAAIADSQDHLAPFMPWVAEEPLPRDRRLALIERWQQLAANGGDKVFGIWLDGTAVGGCGLHQRIGPGGLEIGYWVSRQVVRRRVAATTAALLTEEALSTPGIDRVEIHHAVENVASAGVPRLLGYHRLPDTTGEPAVPGLSGRSAVWRLTGDCGPSVLAQLETFAVRPGD